MNEATTAVVADTHIVIRYVLNAAKLSRKATAALEGWVVVGEPIRVSAHSLIELVYAVERATNPFTESDRQAVLETFDAEDSPFQVVPVTAEIANRVAFVPRAANADPGDRVVAATAEVLGLSIVSADSKFPSMTSVAVSARSWRPTRRAGAGRVSIFRWFASPLPTCGTVDGIMGCTICGVMGTSRRPRSALQPALEDTR